MMPAWNRRALLVLCAWTLLLGGHTARAQEGWKDGWADSSGVKIHYVTAGVGPLVVLLHGFPDFHYTWRDQIPALARTCQVAALAAPLRPGALEEESGGGFRTRWRKRRPRAKHKQATAPA